MVEQVGRVLLLGVLNGGTYALFALGVTLLFRGTKSISFALGEVGTAGLVMTWWTIDHGAPWLVGAGCGRAFGELVAETFQQVVIRRLGRGARVNMDVE